MLHLIFSFPSFSLSFSHVFDVIIFIWFQKNSFKCSKKIICIFYHIKFWFLVDFWFSSWSRTPVVVIVEYLRIEPKFGLLDLFECLLSILLTSSLELDFCARERGACPGRIVERKWKLLRTNGAQSSVVDNEESRHNHNQRTNWRVSGPSWSILRQTRNWLLPENRPTWSWNTV